MTDRPIKKFGDERKLKKQVEFYGRNYDAFCAWNQNIFVNFYLSHRCTEMDCCSA